MSLINGNRSRSAHGVRKDAVTSHRFRSCATDHHDLETKRRRNGLLDQKLIIS